MSVIDYQVSRHTFIWLLVCLSFLMLPHLYRYPLLLLPLLLCCLVWRILIFLQRFQPPTKIIKIGLVIFGYAAVAILPYPLISLETTVAILLTATLFKLIEMNNKRDVLILVYLSYFVIVTQLLFDQTLLSGLYMLTGILLVTTCLISDMTHQQGLNWIYPLKYSAKMMCISIPIMVLSFIVFPRMDPFWTVPLPGGKSKTGISETMSPGMISQLAQSDALAFRVRFLGDMPRQSELYWRGPTLSQFDGTTWHLNASNETSNLSDTPVNKKSDHLRYEIIMEPSYNTWLFALPLVVSSNKAVKSYTDYSLKHHLPITQKMAFELHSDILQKRDITIDPLQKQQALKVPTHLNPETQALAKSLLKQSVTKKDYLDRVKAFYLDQPFFYTLNPPIYRHNSIDEFLFTGRQGFCEHYASSYVILMRLAGIPARVVTGYQGGEINTFENYLAVRQMDAHAWAEVWLEGEGWIRVDPTAFVSPERIQQSSQNSFQNDAFYLAQTQLAHRHLSSFQWYQYLQQRYDQLNYLWTVNVLSFQGKQQRGLLEKILGEVNWQSLAQLITFSLIVVFLSLYGLLGLPSRGKSLNPTERQYRKFLRKLSRKGIKKPLYQGPYDFLNDIEQNYPAYFLRIKPIITLYVELTYSETKSPAIFNRRFSQFKRAIAEF